MRARRFVFALLAILPACSVFAEGPHTPKAGSAERKAIADAGRAVIRGALSEPKANIVFVFKTLKVQGGWAWMEAQPKRADAANSELEPVTLLLRETTGGTWKVVDSLPDEVASADDPAAAKEKWLKSLPSRHEGLPATLLPVSKKP